MPLKPLRPKRNSKISKNKYLKPGALAQIRNSRSTSKSCHVIGKKRILLDTEKENSTPTDISALASPILSPVLSPNIDDETRPAKLPKTPKTPQDRDFDSDSRLESLPLDLLVCSNKDRCLLCLLVSVLPVMFGCVKVNQKKSKKGRGCMWCY
jgi:hypothetical protein